MSGEPKGGAAAKSAEDFNKTDKSKLKRYIDKVDGLKMAQADIAAQIKETMADAETEGFVKKRILEVLRKRAQRRKYTRAQVEHAQLELDLYWQASGADKFADALDEDELDAEDFDPPARGGQGRGRGFN